MTAASSPLPLTHHPDSSTSGTQPVPAHLCRQSRAPAHSVGRTRWVQHLTAQPPSSTPCHLPTAQPATRGSADPGQTGSDLTKSCKLLRCPSLPWRPRADRLAALGGPGTEAGQSDSPARRTDRPADPPTPPATPPHASPPVPAQPRRPAPRERSPAAQGPLTPAARGTRQGTDAVGSAAAANAPRATSLARSF